MVCNRVHIYDEITADLPPSSQHYTSTLVQCAGCAYHKGYLDGKQGKKRSLDIQSLDTVPPDKYPPGKTKDPIHAYDMGFEFGEKERLTAPPKKWWYWILNFRSYIFGIRK